MRRVYTAQNPAEAHLVAGFLEEEGIRCVVEGEMLTGAREVALDPSMAPTVAVLDEDESRAREVLARHDVARLAEQAQAFEEVAGPTHPARSPSTFPLLSAMVLVLAVVGVAFVVAIGLPLFAPLAIVLVVAVLALGGSRR